MTRIALANLRIPADAAESLSFVKTVVHPRSPDGSAISPTSVKVTFFKGTSLLPVPGGGAAKEGALVPYPQGRHGRGAAAEVDQAGSRAARMGKDIMTQ